VIIAAMGDRVALLFTDIEGSTRMLERLGERYEELQVEHDRLMRRAIAAAGGHEIHVAGDSFFSTFPRVVDAVSCAREVQLALKAERWPGGEAPRVRMGIHSGTPTPSDGDFVGMDVHRAARVMAVAAGGQVLMTEAAQQALGNAAQVRDLGHHRLKDLPAPEHLFQLLAPELCSEFPPLRSLNRSNLPTPANPLVGRSAEVSDALTRLAQPEVRLLTLLGPGGAGKSRLAIQVAAEAVAQYRDGVWLVLLAPLQKPDLMVSEIARVLEVDVAPGKQLEYALTSALAERELLLVLDNFEHLPDATGVVANLLGGAPRIDVLATSREPLRISGEHRLDVPPLPPDDATELFVRRARAVRPDLVLDEQDVQAVQRICTRLDGLPLALELAAARASVFSPRALEARLAEGLPMPAGARDLPERQRTLRATIDWSYRLLDQAEQRLLASLSPFVGGVRLHTAERLWDLDGVEGLISLAEKSLLRRREDADAEPRFWILELIRQYAAEVAEADGLTAEAVDRHGRCYYALTEESRPRLIGRDQRKWLDRLERDHANLRAALEHFTEQGSDRALRMASTLTWFWDMRGYQLEARRRLDEALQRVPPGSPNRGDALRCAGWMAGRQGDPETAQTLQRAALPLLLESGDHRLIVQIYSRLAVVAEMLHDDDDANSWHEQAIATARAAGDAWALGIALNNYAITRTVRSDTQRAMSLLEEALAVLRPTGDAYTISMAVANVAEYALNSDDPYGAQTLVEEALEPGRQIDFRPMIAGMLEFRAVIALELGDLDTAAARAREALEVGIPFQGESIAVRLTLAAALAAIRGQPLRAATLWGAAEHVYAQNGIDEPPIHERLRARWEPQARTDAGEQAGWDTAWKAGAQMTIEDALAVAAGGRDDDIELAQRGSVKPTARV
jgi:predicted ATPase/class 3 adenylate cyclase